MTCFKFKIDFSGFIEDQNGLKICDLSINDKENLLSSFDNLESVILKILSKNKTNLITLNSKITIEKKDLDLKTVLTMELEK